MASALLSEGINNHVKFATLAMGQALNQEKRNYLTCKYELLKEEVTNMDPCLWTAHLFQLPYKIVALAVQTVFDVLAATFFVGAATLTLGTNRGLKEEMKGRIYNLLVADTLSWLSVPASIVHPSALSGANSLHLGTLTWITDKNFQRNDCPFFVD